MTRRFAELLITVSCVCALGPGIQMARADAPATDLARSFSGMVTVCDGIISRADIDSTARDQNLTLSNAARAAETREGANPSTGISAFFGADTQIRSASNQTPAGLALFVVAADGGKCEAFAFGGADLARALVDGLTAGPGGWQRTRHEAPAPPTHLDDITEAQRPNGDHFVLHTTARDGGVEIVEIEFERGAVN